MKELAQLALKLKELDRQIIKAIVELSAEDFTRSVTAFNETKKSIKAKLLKNPVVSLPDVRDREARTILNKIGAGQPLPGEKALRGSPIGEVISDELTWEELEKFAMDEFYVWFGPYEYVESLYNIGSLILSIGQLPPHLKNFVDEARQCYAFQQYAAVYSLSRTMLEICVKDLCIKYEILPMDCDNVTSLSGKKPDLYKLINALCDKISQLSRFRSQLHNMRKKGNFIIHGNRTVKASEARQMLRDTLSAIHSVYEVSSSIPS